MKKSAPKIQESAQEKTLRQHGANLSTEASALKGQFGARAAKVAAADNSGILKTAAAGANARSLQERLRTPMNAEGRVAAILGASSSNTELQNKAHATALGSKVGTLGANIKRGLGVTSSVLSSLSQQASAAQQASEIDVQSRMDASAAKMQAIGSAFGGVMDYKAGQEAKAQNQQFMDLLKAQVKPVGGP